MERKQYTETISRQLKGSLEFGSWRLWKSSSAVFESTFNSSSREGLFSNRADA